MNGGTAAGPAVPATGEDFVFAHLERPDAWTIALAAAPLAARIGGPEVGLRLESYPVETQTYLEGLGLTMLPSTVGPGVMLSGALAATLEDRPVPTSGPGGRGRPTNNLSPTSSATPRRP